MASRIFTGLIVVCTAFAAALFVWTMVHALLYAPASATYAPPAATITAGTSSKPVRLQIPSLDIDARVQYVGVTKKGDMGIPDNFRDVAWYKYGPTPGQLGSAVMSGHLDNGLALPGVFKHLGDLKPGSDVYVITEDGSKLRFVVVGTQTYPYKEAPRELIFVQNDAARLNLVTCTGSWVASDKTYDERIVVFTEYVDETAADSS